MGAIKRKHVSYMAYLGENLTISLITKALTCVFKEESTSVRICMLIRKEKQINSV